jgi:hypothetical protein
MSETTRIPPTGGSGPAPPRKSLVEACETCRFWLEGVGQRPEYEKTGACRRYPPVVVDYDGGHLADATVSPWTDSSTWCGEWQAKRVDR